MIFCRRFVGDDCGLFWQILGGGRDVEKRDRKEELLWVLIVYYIITN